MRGEPVPLLIREARPDEHESIAALTLAAYMEYSTVMRPSAWAGLRQAVLAALASLEEGAQWIVAERDGRLVGSVMLLPPASDAYRGAIAKGHAPELRLLAVDPGARGAGVGRLLVEACIQRAAEMGADELGLHTSESMRTAIRMYESLDFRRDPERDFQPEGAELVQAYRLVLRDRPDLGR